MFEALGSIAAGGVTGLLGSAITAVAGHFRAKGERRHELDLRRLDIEQARVEGEQAERRAQIELTAQREVSADAALQSSYQEAGRRWSRRGDSLILVAVDVVRGLTRPLLTFGLVAVSVAIYFREDISAIQEQVVNTVLYCASTCVLWWFGSRPQRP